MKPIRIIVISLLILILGVILFVIFLNQTLTGGVVETQDEKVYSYTKAVCNETNYCQDYEVVCEGERVVGMSPITGAVAQYSEDWEDPRDEGVVDRLCG